jgi:hypothetical protein
MEKNKITMELEKELIYRYIKEKGLIDDFENWINSIDFKQVDISKRFEDDTIK